MRTKPLSHLFLLLAAMLLLLAACNRADDAPVTDDRAPEAVIDVTDAPAELTATAVSRPTDIPARDLAYDWAPQVVDSSPQPGEPALLNGAITVRFDQPMNRDAVEAAFAVARADSDDAVTGAFSWPRPDTVIFTPQGELTRQQAYRVRIDDSATAESGMALETAVELQLQTVGYLAVSQTIPNADADEIAADSAITVVFNRPVVPLVATGEQAGLPQPLTFEPPLAGTGEWVSSSIYRFEPETALDGGTTYRATIAAGLTDVNDGLLEDDFSWDFTTRLPDVVSTVPEGRQRMVDPTQPITITFNAPMGPVTSNAVSFDPPVAFSSEWQEEGRVLVLTPDEMLALDTQYTLTVADSARSAGNGAQMARPYNTVFNTVPFPRVIGTTPANNAVADRWQGGFSLRFASPMNWEMVEEQIQIAPEPRRTDFYANSYEDTNELYVNYDLTRNATYTVTVPGSVEDVLGNLLGSDYTFSFTAADYEPIASFNLPGAVSQVSNAFPTDVEMLVRNVENVTVRLYDAGLPVHLLREPYQVNDRPPTSDVVREWTLTPDVTGDSFGLETISLADGGTLANGVYLLWADAPGLEEYSRYWQVQRHLLIVADTNIVVKEMADETHVWLTDLETGEPAAGRTVRGFLNNGSVAMDTAVTDENGFATLAHNSNLEYLTGVTVISGEPGQPGFGIGSSTWTGSFQPWNLGLRIDTSDERPIFAYIYTDRPIYRPGDTVYFKGIVREPNFGRYNLSSREDVTLQLNPQFYMEGGEPLSESFTLSLDDSGVFTGAYTLPDDVTLGDYQLFIDGMNYEGFRTFTVADYRKPEFQLTLTPDTPEAIRGDAVEMTLNASYFFGGSASDLQVSYTVYDMPFRPQVPGPRYSFGDDASFVWQDYGFFGRPGVMSDRGQYLIGGDGRTDANGNFTFTLPADMLADADPGGRVATVEVIVADLAQFPIAASTEVVFHAGETYVGVTPDDYFNRSGQETAVDLVTVDWDGNAIPNQDVEVVFYSREWEYERASQYNIYYTSWTPVDTEVARTTVTTDASGDANASFTPEFPGSYIAVATVADDAGREHFSSTYLWVAGDNFFGWRSDPRARTMELTLDQDSYAPGDTAQLLVQSPFARPVQAWLTIERGTLIEQRVITVNGSEIVDVPITAIHAPNIYITVVAIKPVEGADAEFPYADMRVGITEATVSTEQLRLNIDIQPQADSYEPGDTAVYTIRVTDYSGSPVQADLSLALVDLAVLTLKEDNAPNIVDGFYSPQPLRSQLGSGLFVSGEGLEPEVPLEGGGLGGGGGDGGFLASAVVDEETARRNFPDTAYWEAQIQTDAGGQATVEIPLPDALTTWRLSSKAFTADNLVGQNYRDVVVALPLLLRPVTPRFFTVGDVVQIGTFVNNNTDTAIEATVSVAADGLRLPDEVEQTVTVAANGRALVRWEVFVEDGRFVDLTFRVNGGGYSDATKPTFGIAPDQLVPVYRYNAEDVVGSAGQIDGAGRRVEAILLPENADLAIGTADVTLSPSLAAALTQALATQADLDLDTTCAAAYTHRLLPNLAVLRTIRELDLDEARLEQNLNETIPAQIAAIQRLAHRSGGWSWCGSSRVNPWLTAYSLQALLEARAAGFDVNAQTIDRAAGYLANRIKDPERITNGWEANKQAYFLYVLAEADAISEDALMALFAESRDLLDPYGRALLAMAFDLSVDDADAIDTLLSDLNTSAVVSATGTHWERETQYWENLGTDIRDTAVIVEALSRLQPDSPLLAPAVRWLMVARTAEYWSTQMETAWSVYALSSYMIASGEFDADYDYGLAVNGETAVSGAFSRDNILTTETVSVPLGNLTPGESNFFAFARGGGDGRFYYTLHLNSFIDADAVEPVDRGFSVSRVYYDAACDLETETCQPITEIAAGQQVRVVLSVILPEDRIYVRVEDPLPAGAEAIDPNLDTNSPADGGRIDQLEASYRYGYWGWWSFDHIQYRDEKVVFTSMSLPAGTYQYSYLLQANIPGQFQVMPATAREDFFPEVFGRSAGLVLTITE